MMKDSIPEWCRVKQAAVRVGGRGGAVIGYLSDHGDRYSFCYCISSLVDPNAKALDPIRLPKRAEVVFSDSYAFDGRLQMFRHMLPGSYAERGPFTWFSDAASRTLGRREVARDRLPMPETDLTRLAWSSYCFSLPKGVNGLWIDPATPCPSDLAGGIYSSLAITTANEVAIWQDLKAALKPVAGTPAGNIGHFLRSFLGGQDVPLDFLQSILPLPGSILKVRMDVPGAKKKMLPSIQYLEKVTQGDNIPGVRRLRVRSAYLRLAAHCGLDVALPVTLRSGSEINYISTLLAQSPYVGMPMNAKNIVVSHADNASRDPWLADSTKSDVYAGENPWYAYRDLSRFFRARDIPFDHLEAYRRLVFSVLSGVFMMDDSPIYLRPLRPECRKGFFQANAIQWSMAPITVLKPMLLPYKTAWALQPRLVPEVAIAGIDMGLSSEDVTREIERVGEGLKMWRHCAFDAMLDDYEAEGFCPALVNTPERVGLPRGATLKPVTNQHRAQGK